MRQNATKCNIACDKCDIAFCRILSHFVACDKCNKCKKCDKCHKDDRARRPYRRATRSTHISTWSAPRSAFVSWTASHRRCWPRPPTGALDVLLRRSRRTAPSVARSPLAMASTMLGQVDRSTTLGGMSIADRACGLQWGKPVMFSPTSQFTCG